MLDRLFSRKYGTINNSASILYNSSSFYRALEKDICFCQKEAIIESPFITTRRLNQLLPLLRKAISRGVTVIVNTKPPQEHNDYLKLEAELGISKLQAAGVEVLFTGGHHRKLAIFDRQILWEGSLNILSYNDSCEIMRRINSRLLAEQMVSFINIVHYLK